MPDRLRPTERHEQLRESDRRLFRAFLYAAAVPTILFVGLMVIYRSYPILARGLEPWEISEILRIFISPLFVAAIPVTLIMLIFVIPVYHLMRRLDWLTTTSVLSLSFLFGVLAAFIPLLLGGAIVLDLQGKESWNWAHIAGTLVIAFPVGICALIGGIVFCRMTIWRNVEADGVSNGPD